MALSCCNCFNLARRVCSNKVSIQRSARLGELAYSVRAGAFYCWDRHWGSGATRVTSAAVAARSTFGKRALLRSMPWVTRITARFAPAQPSNLRQRVWALELNKMVRRWAEGCCMAGIARLRWLAPRHSGQGAWHMAQAALEDAAVTGARTPSRLPLLLSPAAQED
jgi:hypothetical protein